MDSSVRKMPIIRSPQKSRAAQSVRLEEEGGEPENVDKRNQVVSSSTGPAAKRTNGFIGMKRSPPVSVVADSTTRIWELEGEIARLERDKRMYEEERRKFSEEKELENADLTREFGLQLDAEKRKCSKEIEASNAKWREEVEELNMRQERKEKDAERKMLQIRQNLEEDLQGKFELALEASEREKSKLKLQIENLELDLKEKSKLQNDLDDTQNELNSLKDSHTKSLLGLKEATELSKAEMAANYNREITTAVEAAKAEIRLEHARTVNQALEESRAELRMAHEKEMKSAMDTMKEEFQRVQSKALSEAKMFDERMRSVLAENQRLADELKDLKSCFEDVKSIKERCKILIAQNENLRANLQQEQQDRAIEERKRMVELEITQQRTDEAVARALSVVKRTEDRMSEVLLAGGGSTLQTRQRRPSLPILQSYPVPTASSTRIPSSPRMSPANRPKSIAPTTSMMMAQQRPTSTGRMTPSYLLQTQSSLAKSEYDFRKKF